MGRIKTERFEVRMTPAEKARLKEKADKSRMSMTEYILALSERKKIYVVDDLGEINYRLIKIGVNINQITRNANINHCITEEQIEYIMKKQAEISDLLYKLVHVCKCSKDEIIKI